MGIRFGIIGLGKIAVRFASAVLAARGAELEAVAARDIDRAAEFKNSYGAKRCYGSYDELIADPCVDAVYIALPHNFHYEIAMRAIVAGKAVICEKPMVTCKADAVRLAEAACKRGVLLMEAMWTRCFPGYRAVRKWVADKRIGTVKLIDASFCFGTSYNPESRLFNPDLAGGAMYDVGVYVIEFATGVMDEEPELVKSVSTFCGTGVDDFTLISLRFPSGALASLSCGLVAKTGHDAYIYGTDGRIVVYNFHMPSKCELYDKDGTLVEVFDEPFEQGFVFQIEHFAGLYADGKLESDFIPLRDTIACAGIFDEMNAQMCLQK